MEARLIRYRAAMPIIESKSKEKLRLLSVNYMCEVTKINIAKVKNIILDDTNGFIKDVDYFEIQRENMADKELMNFLEGKKKSSRKRKNTWYLISERGFEKLLSKFSGDKKIDIVTIRSAFLGYFKKQDELKKEYFKAKVDEAGIKRIFAASKKNVYLKEISRALKPPRGGKGKKFKDDKIQKFLGKVNEDMEKFLLNKLEVNDILEIPVVAFELSERLIEEGYTLSNVLLTEFKALVNSLEVLRLEVLEDNKKNSIATMQILDHRLQYIKSLYKGDD